ncbi:MAG: hypothetical protein HRU19_04935 [Pseudobacteriovorax sp.]|nr:hypothetical protein [Pseudobacteriovorax sp.]
MKLLLIMAVCAGLGLLSACRGGTSSESGEGSVTGTTLTGVFKSSAGSQSEMASWVVAFVERDTGIVKVGVLGSLGNYSIEDIRISQPQTMVLLDPQYRVSAVLATPGETAGTVLQYFTTTSLSLPSVVHQGPILKFSELSGISWTTNVATDTDGDSIPDGLETQTALADTDGDTILNSSDSDLDGDGIANWFDSDDDGDGTFDPFDTDANDDGLLDITQAVGDLYFTGSVEFISVQAIQDVQSDGSLSSEVLFTLKVAEGYLPASTEVRGPSVLLDGATVTSTDLATGNETAVAWDGLLVDDGLSEDGAASDLVYARKVSLTLGTNPKASQVVFFDVTGDDGSTVSYAYTFPALITGVVAGSYDAATRVITKTGTPFGTEENYIWSVSIFDATGIKVYSSESLAGPVDTFTVPETILDDSQTYTAKVVANTFDRINSFPTWTVRSASFSIQ